VKVARPVHRGGKRSNAPTYPNQLSTGEFFGYRLQTWLAVVFVDPDGVLASILFKTESLDNFEEARHEVT
jgi:hypothetical protein